MANEKEHPHALLGLNIGGINSRVSLIGISKGKYHLLGSHLAPTSLGQDVHIGNGVAQALQALQQKTDHLFLDEAGGLLMPVDRIGRGLDRVGLVISAARKKKVALLGLSDQGSLRAARALVDSLPLSPVVCLDFASQIEEQRTIETLITALPEIIIIVGGENKGAAEPLHWTIEIVRVVCELLPVDLQPLILFAGNSYMEATARERLERVARLRIVPNLQPVYDHYDLAPAQGHLERRILRSIKTDIFGAESLFALTENLFGLAGCGTERMLRWLSQMKAPDSEIIYNKGLMAIDLGGMYTNLVASKNGHSGAVLLDKFPKLSESERVIASQAIYRWSDVPATFDEVDQFLCNYALVPGWVPDTRRALSLSLAFARYRLQEGLKRLANNYNWFDYHPDRGLAGHFEPVIVSGAVLTGVPDPVDVMCTLVDGLQPRQITTMVLDHHHLFSLLAKLAEVEPLVPVHLLSSPAFTNLGSVISLAGDLPGGKTALTVHVKPENGSDFSREIQLGGLIRLEVPLGETAVLELVPHRRVDIGFGGQGQGGRIKVIGGLLGVVIDARGRPINLPKQPEMRRELMNHWKRMLRGNHE